MGTGVIATVVETRGWIEEDRQHGSKTQPLPKPTHLLQPPSAAHRPSNPTFTKPIEKAQLASSFKPTSEREIVAVERIVVQPDEEIREEEEKR